MKRLGYLFLLLLVLIFAGCGGGGSDSGGVSTTLTPEVNTGGGGTIDTTTGEGGTPANITLTSSLADGAKLTPGSQITITAYVTDANAVPVPNGTLVTFAATTGNITGSQTTAGGRALVNYIYDSGDNAGTVVISAAAGDSAGQTLSITIESQVAASISVKSIAPSTIGLKGGGSTETSRIVYLVKDANGSLATDGTEVEFKIQTSLGGGESISTLEATSLNGEVTTTLQSGTVAGTVTVLGAVIDRDYSVPSTTIGRTNINDPSKVLATTEAKVTIAGGTADAAHFSLAADLLNMAGGVTYGLENTITAFIADSFGNVIADGTQISFMSECGTIGSSGTVSSTNNFSQAITSFRTSAPMVPNLTGLAYNSATQEGNPGLCRIVAFTPGAESYQDLNGNGTFDTGDFCTTDLDEPYIDANDSGRYEPGEKFIDANSDGSFTAADGTCSLNTMIWTSMNILMSGPVASLNVSPAAPPYFDVEVGKSSNPITFHVKDIYGNGLVEGSKFSVTTTKGTLSGVTEYTFPDSIDTGGTVAFRINSDDSGEGIAEVTMTVTPGTGPQGSNGGERSVTISGSINKPVGTGTQIYPNFLFLSAGAPAVEANGSDTVTLTALTGGAYTVGPVTFRTNLGTFSDGTSSIEVATGTEVPGGTEYTAALTAPNNIGTGIMTAEVKGNFSDPITIDFTAGTPTQMTLTAAPSTVQPAGASTILAKILDVNSNPVSNETIIFSVTPDNGALLEGNIVKSAITNALGTASVVYSAGSPGTDTIEAAAISNSAAKNTATVTVDSGAISAGVLTVTASSPTLPADGKSLSAITATLTSLRGAPIANTNINFRTTQGTFTEADEATPQIYNSLTLGDGTVQAFLKAAVSPALAYVTVSTGGFNQKVQVTFIPDGPDSTTSDLSANPTSLAADGASFSTVSLVLLDANDNLATNFIEPLTLLLSGGGSVVSDNPIVPVNGRAEWTVLAPTSQGSTTLTVDLFSGLSETITFGSPTSGDPANLLVAVSSPKLFVAGVGKKENTTITIQVLDNSGALIDENAYSAANAKKPNLRVSFLTRPNGGEYITGTQYNSVVVSTNDVGSNDTIDVLSKNGLVTLNLQSGALPGNVEIKVEALLKENGDDLAALSRPSAALPQITIASGPPHTIVLSDSTTGVIDDLNVLPNDYGEPKRSGWYRRFGAAIVTDRYGNAVPDDTTINLGLLDSVIVEGTDGTIAYNSAVFSSAGPTYSDGTPLYNTLDDIATASIPRNNDDRSVQPNDRVIIFNGRSEDKGRHVSSVAGNTVTTQAIYKNTKNNGNYVIGAALLGGEIAGIDQQAQTLTPGTMRTQNGLASFAVTYPSGSDRIMIGCRPWLDTRYAPLNSARVYIYGSAADDSATTVSSSGQFCFAPIAGAGFFWAGDVVVTENQSVFDSGYYEFILRDGGDGVSVPFYPVSKAVGYDTLGTFAGCVENGTNLGTEALCEANFGFGWHNDFGACIDRSTDTEEKCTAKSANWTWFKGLPSDFKVQAYVGFPGGGDDLNGDGIPEDIDKDGRADVVDAYATKIDPPYNSLFYQYPYTREGGVVNVFLDITGNFPVSGDKALVGVWAEAALTTITVEVR